MEDSVASLDKTAMWHGGSMSWIQLTLCADQHWGAAAGHPLIGIYDVKWNPECWQAAYL